MAETNDILLLTMGDPRGPEEFPVKIDEAEVERVAEALGRLDIYWQEATPGDKLLYRNSARELLATHDVTPKVKAELTQIDVLTHAMGLYSFVDHLGHPLENCVEYRAMVRAAQLSDVRERERVAQTSASATLREQMECMAHNTAIDTQKIHGLEMRISELDAVEGLNDELREKLEASEEQCAELREILKRIEDNP